MDTENGKSNRIVMPILNEVLLKCNIKCTLNSGINCENQNISLVNPLFPMKAKPKITYLLISCSLSQYNCGLNDKTKLRHSIGIVGTCFMHV